MTTVTLTVDTAENAELLAKLLASLDFVKDIKTMGEDEDLTPAQIALLDERLEAIEAGKMGFRLLDLKK
jgi:hypothetical protein